MATEKDPSPGDRPSRDGTEDAGSSDYTDLVGDADELGEPEAPLIDDLDGDTPAHGQAALDEEDGGGWGDSTKGIVQPAEQRAESTTSVDRRPVAIEYVGDADAIGDLPLQDREDREGREDLGSRLSEDASLRARRIGAELKQLEIDVREILDAIDPRRKRKLSGTRRWHELQDDIIQWRFTSRVDESALKRLSQLIGRRHYLFRQLSFLSVTRPTWNS